MNTPLPTRCRAFRIRNDDAGYRAALEDLAPEDLTPGEVTIRVQYSSVNYKDALAASGRGKILRRFPLNGGIDAGGLVIASEHPDFSPGDEVLVTGSGLSETRDGGYSEYLKAAAEDTIPLPPGLTLRQAMGLGTAGFTAALALFRMEQLGLEPEAGPVVVTGASGGVGSLAVNLLHHAGYEVHAITGKIERFDWLADLGAAQCIDRHGLWLGDGPLESARWAAAIDNAGGEMLAGLTRVIKPWGMIASCGLTAGDTLRTTVMPFIIRGISLIGINSAGCPRPIRLEIWQRLAGRWKPPALDRIVEREIRLDELPAQFEAHLAGQITGRTVVRID